MKPHYSSDKVTLWHGDCIDVLAELDDNSVDSIVTDPPYGLSNTTPAQVADTIIRWVGGERDYLPKSRGFMGATWDGFVPPVAVWDECIRVLKPGGHMAVFAGSRTQDLMGLSVRLAGFDIRDSVAWLYGSGFPKSMDVSKAIDREAGAERVDGGREWRGGQRAAGILGRNEGTQTRTIYDAPATPEAERWQGWGTALKPGHEPIILARKPFPSTVAANVQEWGTGALNIDGCRIGTTETLGRVNNDRDPDSASAFLISEGRGGTFDRSDKAGGRWPANVALDADQAEALDQQSGHQRDGVAVNRNRGDERPMEVAGAPRKVLPIDSGHGGSGGASRYFFVAPDLPVDDLDARFMYTAKAGSGERPRIYGVAHSTVKPLDLMRWLVRLITPPGGTVLDPFGGSGTTAEAAILERFRAVVVEREADFLPLIVQRVIRRVDPVEAIRQAGGDLGLFE